MKKVININFQGRVIPIEESAYEILKQYIESLRQHFAAEEGKDEIINDIEGRIAELFSEVLTKGSTCITDANVLAIIASIGRPEDFDAELNENTYTNSTHTKSGSTGNTSSQTYTSGSYRQERLYRDENNKLFGGVCSGLANYFGIDKLVIRIIFILFTFGYGFGFIVYLILWVAIPSTASTNIGSVRKRLFRDPENKLIAGVCGGLASYFGINVWVPRILFLIPFLSFVTSWHRWGLFGFPNFINLTFSPGTILIYIILWLILPEAATTSDRLEMKGEKIDINSIKNTIQKDMEGFTGRAKEFGAEVGERAKKMGSDLGSRSKQFSAEASQAARRGGKTFGDIIALLFKIFAYSILAIVLTAIIIALFGAGVTITSLLPFKPYLIADGWQSALAWGTLIFFIWIPVVALITFIIRKVTKSKRNSNVMRYGFAAMWVLGLICFLGLIASLSNEFSYHNSPDETNVFLSDPGINKLEVKVAKNSRYYFSTSFLDLEPFASIDEDTAFVRNIHLRILKSDNDSFHVAILKMAYGATRQAAGKRVEDMNFNITQKDSSLYFDRGIPIDKNDKFRNQTIYTTIYVPVGKRILVDDEIGWNNDFHFGFRNDFDEWDWSNDNHGYNWQHNTEYMMTATGLKAVNPTDENDDNNDENNDNQQAQPQQNDTQPDTSHYHYQPSKTQDSPAKKINASVNNVKVNAVKISDLASSFLERLAL